MTIIDERVKCLKTGKFDWKKENCLKCEHLIVLLTGYGKLYYCHNYKRLLWVEKEAQ